VTWCCGRLRPARPGGPRRSDLALTGPAALTYDEVAAVLGARYEPVSPDRFKAARIAAGVPEWRAEDLADIASAYRAEENIVTDDLPALLGRPATSLQQFVSDCWR
jgi:hypothetical protein